MPVSLIYLFVRYVQIRVETLSRAKTMVKSVCSKVKIFIPVVRSRAIEVWECYSINRIVRINRVLPRIRRNLSRHAIHPLRGIFVGKFVKL